MLKRLCLVAVTLFTFAASAQAAVTAVGAGPRIGFSTDPDQLVLGGQLVLGEVAPSLTFDPNLELGLGDDVTTINLNFDLHYHIRIQDTDWSPYFGAGLGIYFFEVDLPGPDDSVTEVGGGLVLGVGVPTRAGNRFFSEMKFGLSNDIPSLKLVAGWNFRI